MILKTHKLYGLFYFESHAQYKKYLMMNKANPEIQHCNFTDATQAEMIQFIKRQKEVE